MLTAIPIDVTSSIDVSGSDAVGEVTSPAAFSHTGADPFPPMRAASSSEESKGGEDPFPTTVHDAFAHTTPDYASVAST